jgi:predicted DNA-binding transcriptional regulator AlpA
MTRPAFMSRETLAQALELKPGAIDQLVTRGLLPQPVKIGDAIRWNWAEVEQWLTNAKRPSDASEIADIFKQRAAHVAKAPAARAARS